MTGDTVTHLLVIGRNANALEALRLHGVHINRADPIGRRVSIISDPSKPGQVEGFDPKTTGYVFYVGAFGEDFVSMRRLLRMRLGDPFSTIAFGLAALRRSLPPDDDKGVPA